MSGIRPFTSQEWQKSWNGSGYKTRVHLDGMRSTILCWPCFLLIVIHQCPPPLSMDLPTPSYLYLDSDILIIDLVFPKTLPSALVTCSYLNTNRHFGSQGYRSSHSLGINHQYATLMSPNKSETAVCCSSIFCLFDDWGAHHWLPHIGLVRLA